MASSSAQGFLLLTLQNARLSAPFLSPPVQTGLLSLECVTIPIPASPGKIAPAEAQRDVWLVLRINEYELPLSAADPMMHSRANRTFTLQAPEGRILVTLPTPISSADSEDQETFEVLLSQYGALQETDGGSFPSDSKSYPAEKDTKGRLVLVDEDDGEVVGTLGEQFTVREDPNVKQSGKAPVIIEIPEDGGQEIYVHSVNPEEQDFILRSAQFVSRGIMFATDMIGKGMDIAADKYVKSATPNQQPMVFSETAKANIRRVHGISGQAVKVSSRTTGMIHGLIDKGLEKMGGAASSKRGERSAAYFGQQGQSRGPPPQLPPRGEKLGVAGPSAGKSRSPSPTPPPLPPRKPRLLNRLLISTDLLLTTLENSAHQLIGGATTNLSKSMGHKYGAEMGSAVKDVGDSVRNVGVVYVDVRGVGRRALIRKVGKGMIKGKMGSKEVVFGAEQVRDDGSLAVGPGAAGPSTGGASGSGSMPGGYKV